MKSLFIIFLGCLFSIVLAAQAPTRTAKTIDDFIVKDSSGMIYPTNIVKGMMMSGKYMLRPVPGSPNEMLLVTRTEKDRERAEANAMKPKESNFFKEGETLAPFKERDMKGNKYNLKELAGKVVVLNFWFINCPPCRREIPELNAVVAKYKDNKDVVFLAIALDDKSALADFLKETPFDYNIVDNGRFTAQQYGINLYPTHVVVDRRGKILFHTSGLGSGTVAWIKKSIEAGLNNATPK